MSIERKAWIAALFVPACGLIAWISDPHWANAPAPDETQELRKTVAVQGVQLQDARDRIHALEVDLDRLAPHAVPSRP